VDNTNFSAFDDYLTDANKALGISIVLDADFVSDLSNYLAQLTSNPNNIHNLADESDLTHTFPLEDYPEGIQGYRIKRFHLATKTATQRFAEAY